MKFHVAPSGAYVAFSMDDGVVELDLSNGALGGYDVSPAGFMLKSGQVLLTPDGRNLYVANSGPQNILSIDAAGRRVRGVLPIPTLATNSLTSLPDSSKVYVGAGTGLYEITVADNSFRRIPFGNTCFYVVAASPREPGVIYAIGGCGGHHGMTLLRCRVTDGTVQSERELTADVWPPTGVNGRLVLAAQEDTGYLGTCAFSNDRGYGKLHVLDLKTLEVAASCDIDYGVTDFVLREDTGRIYTIGFWSGASPNRLPVTEWDTASRAVTRQMFFDNCSDLRAIALDPANPGVAWYTEGDRSEIRAVDLTSGDQVARWLFTPGCTMVPYSFATAGWRAFVGCGQTAQVFEIDMRTGATHEVKLPPAVGRTRAGFYSGGLLHYLWNDRITSVDPDRWTVAREVHFGRTFSTILGTPVGDQVAFIDFVPGNMLGLNLVVVDAATGQIRKVIPLPGLPTGHRVIVSPEGNKAYVIMAGMQNPAHILVFDTATWDLRTEVVLPTLNWENGSSGFCNGVFDTVNRIAYLTGHARVFRLDMDSDQLLESLCPSDAYIPINRQDGWSTTALCCLQFAPGNRLLVVSGDSHQVFTYDLSAKQWLTNLINAHGYFQSDGTGSPDGRFLFTANSRSDSVSMFDTVRGRLLRVIDLHAPERNGLLPTNVVNGASFLTGPVAPGEVLTIFGAGLGPEDGVTADFGGAGVRVLFDGVEAPLGYVQSTQINVLVPADVSTGASVRLAIDYQGLVTEELELATAESAPGLFTADGSGTGPALALDSAGKAVSAANPAARGSLISLFVTGAGRTGPEPADGPLLPLTATVGGLDAPVESAATTASGPLAGIVQCGVRIPPGVTPGPALPVVLRAGSPASQAGVTLAVA